MKKMRPFCHSQQCKGRDVDDQDWRVIWTYIDSDYTRRYTLVCQWCGKRQDTALPCDNLPGYREAEAERQKRDANRDDRRMGYSRYR